MKNITVILPIHKWDEEYSAMYENSVKSVEQFYNDVKLIVVGPTNVTSKITFTSDKLETKILVNEGETDFCSQVNLAIDNCDTEWFSLLEVDDEYKSSWLKSMDSYIKENPTTEVFLPIVRDINVEGKFLSYTNESTWAYGFTEKQGTLDNEALLDYQNFQISGGLYKTSVIKEQGKLKENIKLTFGYEFLLRLTHNNIIVMTVPRIGYQHVNFREDSLFWSYKNDESSKMSEGEVKFWLETAKKEFFFKNKRDVNYVVN
mgnify:CR=1 FL=1|jgi:hypothetical protein